MSGRQTHLLGSYKEGVGVPFCKTKGRNLHVTASPSWINCRRCINKWNKEVTSR